MLTRFKGIFSKWYCPKCRKVLKRKDIKYQQDFRGTYTSYWFMCLHCGNKRGIMTLQKRLEQLAVKED